MRSCKWAVAFVLAALSLSLPARAANYSDIWWNANESGWGVTIADHETQLFAVIYDYIDLFGAVWQVVPGGTFSQDRRIFHGDMYVTHGPAYSAPVFDSTLVTATKVGTVTFDFAPQGVAAGTILMTVAYDGGITATKQLTRQPFGSAAPNWGTDWTDIWFNPNESGWGLSVTQHGNNIFGVWFTYSSHGLPTWYAISGGTFSSSGEFSGAMYHVSGPTPFGSTPFDSSQVHATQVGTASISFSNAGAAALSNGKAFTAGFTPVIDGIAYEKRVLPQPFGNAAPRQAAGTCVGTYSYTVRPPFCPGFSDLSTGNLTITGVNINQLGPFVGNLSLTGVAQIDSVGNTCLRTGSTDEANIPFAGAMDLSRSGHADFALFGVLQIHAAFSVGTSVQGTLTDEFGGGGQYSCSYR
jgi:hypothetical protein